MVEFQLANGKTKVLTSAKAKEDGSVDLKVQISANKYKDAKQQRDQQKSRYEQGETSRAGAMHPRVTSRILLNKWQCQKEKDYQRRLEEEEQNVSAKKKDMKESKLSYIGTILSSDTTETKV